MNSKWEVVFHSLQSLVCLQKCGLCLENIGWLFKEILMRDINFSCFYLGVFFSVYGGDIWYGMVISKGI